MDDGPSKLFRNYGRGLFYKTFSLRLMEELAKLQPDKFQEYCHNYAHESADEETSKVAGNISEEWKSDPKYADIPEGSPAIVANGIEEAKKFVMAFLDSIR